MNPNQIKGMKWFLLTFALLCTAGLTLGQKAMPEARNEIKINGFYTLAGIPEISYERILNTETSVGICAALAYQPYSGLQLGITPYFRWFFSKKAGEGFFLESNGAVYSVYTDPWLGEGAGVGFAMGYKMTNASGWVGEIYAGAGRNFLTGRYSYGAYPRLGYCIGRRLGS